MPRNDDAGVYPLSPMQHGMLYQYLSALYPGADVIQYVCELREPLDVDRFGAAWNRVAARHQPFRTKFRWDGAESPKQEVLPQVQLDLQVFDWQDRTPDARDEAFRDLIADDRRRGFDLTVAPATRITLVRWTETEWRCVWSIPHILIDGRGTTLVLCEVFDLYDRGASYEPPAAPQYSAFLEWLDTRDLLGEERYWRDVLNGFTSPTPLPGDGSGVPPRGEAGLGHRAAHLTIEETASVVSFAKSIGVTLSTVVHGAWALLLSHYSGVDDVVFGAARAGRHGTVPNAENVVGLFINTVPVRARCTPDASVRDWLNELRQQQVEVRPYEHTPLADIQRWHGFGATRPLFESVIVFDRERMDGLVHTERPEWTHRRVGLIEPAPFPLSLYARDGKEIELKLAYDRHRIADDTVEQALGHLVTLVRELTKDPDQALKDVRVLSEADRRRQLLEWNSTEQAVDLNRCAHDLVREQAERTPDHIAVADGRRTLTYRELDARANQLAHRLVTMGVEPDARVGVCLERSVDLVVAVLGVLKAGGAYVPLDPEYPAERLEYMARDAGLVALVTADGAGSSLTPNGIPIVDLTRDADSLAHEPAELPRAAVTAEHLAYVIYTSGSTGRPKGVMVEHRNVVNFFAAMDARIPHNEAGTWLAVTSLAFDISVLELLWPLTRGFKIVVVSPLSTGAPRAAIGGPEFSLFYFASGEDGRQDDKYRLLLEGARFADERGFHAVWTPERHFHAFGGLYPNPSVAGAALAAITSRVRIRAGSVVLPLHHPIRIAEEWALVDNLSNGRVDISFASGWQPNDFALAPQNYVDRKRLMMEGIEVVRRLWRGESVAFPGPDGKAVDVRTLPRPRQRDLPIWITTAGSAETYRAAGEAGANVLTHLLGQTVDDVAAMIAVYREARKAAGHAGPGRVTLMLHAFVGADEAVVRETVRKPMKDYLRSSVSLIKGFTGAWKTGRSAGESRVAGDEFDKLSAEDLESLLDFAFERYFETSGLFGTPARCLELVQRVREAGVDEIACLIDFGVPTDQVLSHLEDLDAVRQATTRHARSSAWPALSALIREHGVTHLQCTPSLARMMLADRDARAAMGDLEVMLVGGEPFPGSLAAELRQSVRGRLLNMYGPTETTVWSSTYEVNGERGTMPIGRPIANTRLYVLDHHGQPVPVGVPGELYIGGAGVVRGYLGRPELTAERFIPDPFVDGHERLYRTGDVVRWRADGVIEFLGRADYQVKIRGHRIELGEIEAVMTAHPDVREVVVNPWQRGEGDAVLVAYVVPAAGGRPSEATLRAHAEAQLPSVMVPSHVVLLTSLPLTPNGKVDRKALPAPSGAEPTQKRLEEERPATALEELVADAWRGVLGLERVRPRDNFFALGGNSLTTIQVATRIRESLGIELPLRVIFEAPTVAELAAHLERRLLESADTDALEDLLAELEQPAVGGHRTAPA